MNGLFENNELYRQLPDEMKEKIKGCKNRRGSHGYPEAGYDSDPG